MSTKIIVAGLVLFGFTLPCTVFSQINSATFGTMEARWLGPGTMMADTVLQAEVAKTEVAKAGLPMPTTMRFGLTPTIPMNCGWVPMAVCMEALIREPTGLSNITCLSGNFIM